MTQDMYIVFGVLVVTIVLFMTGRWRLDLIAMFALLALLLTNMVRLDEGLAGFANPLVLMIAGLFVVGAAIFRTGVADRLGLWLGRVAGTAPLRLIAIIMVVTALLSAFMSSTGTVAVMLPVVVALAKNAKISPSKLLMPLAFGSLFGGMLTLIGTPPNIVVSNQLQEGLKAAGQANAEGFGFFTFTPIGLVMLAIGVVFMLTVGRKMLPDRQKDRDGTGENARTEQLSGQALVDDYELDDNILRFEVQPDVAGKTLAEANLRDKYEGTVLGIERPGPEGVLSLAVKPHTALRSGDVLCVQVSEDALTEVKRREAQSLVKKYAAGAPLPKTSMLVEVLLTPRSRLIGRTLKNSGFRDRYHANVLSIKRGGQPVQGNAAKVVLRFGDTLLVEGRRQDISVLRDEHRNFVVVAEPHELNEPLRNTKKAPAAVIIMLGMLVLMTLRIVPNTTAVLLAAVAMVTTGCLTMVQAYRSVNWESVVLIAAILPMATALKKCGGLQLIVNGLLSILGNAGPLVLMGSLFLLTSLFSQVISNTATTVLIAPIAFKVATQMGMQPQAFLITVAIAASTAFATPIASPVNTLVLGPGGYRFFDFLKIGLLLQVLILIATLLVVPLLF